MSHLTSLESFISTLPEDRQDNIHKMSVELITEIELDVIKSDIELAEKVGVFDTVS